MGFTVIYAGKKALSFGLKMSLEVQEVEAPRISRQSANDGGKSVIPTHWPPSPPRGDPWHSFLFEAKSTPGP